MNELSINWDHAPEDATHAGVEEETGRVLFYKDIEPERYRFYSHARDEWRQGRFTTPQVDYLEARPEPAPINELSRQQTIKQFVDDLDVPKVVAIRAYDHGWRKVR